MTEPAIEPVVLEGEDGEQFTVYVESKHPVTLPSPPDQIGEDEDRESYGLAEEAIAKLKDVHSTIRIYTLYAIGAFKDLGGAEVEEIGLKFGLKIGGRTGVPILTEGSAEANFEVTVKCKFPTHD